MKSFRTGTIVCLFLVSALVVSAGNDCRYSAERAEAVKADGVTEVVIDAGAGFLIVNGVGQPAEITAKGKACTSRESYLDDIQISIRRNGERVTIKAEFPSHTFSTASSSLDFEVKVPEGVTLKIDDGSGRLEVRNVAAVDISDGSGSIAINDISGEVSIEDGSGEIRVEAVSGRVDIDDGSGSIIVKNVKNDVEIEDGSGSIDVRDVTGTFTVDDGSGSINAESIGGDFIVENGGSGSIDYSEITGKVELPRD